MTKASRKDIVRLFPGIQDHAVLEITAIEATVDELEAALQLLQDNDAGLIELKRENGDRLNLLCGILAHAEIQLPDER
ncbi:MAG: hypothetical protein OEW73_15395 [Gammaproteobacteria bacterium]|nr:hypothetical protein [Gammaproteobacteria bacterium]MDH5242157.1 hypothetical protein [Gammaproteobacteria bacterium]MDH5262000.1 hypothetical protein [Gammaproteobacteria bacterium]MDH5621477.1 hypothetical protein [Gammaproteobacteria bacterium]